MTRKEIDQQYSSLYQKIYKLELKAVLDDLARRIRYISKSDYFYQLETLNDNYKTLLRYSFDGYKDVQQKTILDGLCASMLRITDEMRQIQIEPELPFMKAEKATLRANLGDDLQISAFDKEEISGHPIEVKFKLIWLTEKLNDDSILSIHRINISESIPWYEKCLVVSALTLSLLNHFDINKFNLLLEFIEYRENQVYQRALTGVILSLLVYDHRIKFYPELIEKLKSLHGDEAIAPELEMVLFQHLMARETDKITHEFETEVLPEMRKMMPKIEDKLQLGDQTEDEDMEGKNPGWKDMIEEVPGLFEKIEKFSRMQMEGGDVFMSTFKLLKRFDFFNSMSNWFIPFHRDHPDISSSFSDSEEINIRLLESLEKAFYICNSDKYSFAFNFQAIPAQQRSMIVTNFEAEFAQMKEMASEEQVLDQSLTSNAVYVQYIQDLYRFFKLFPTRQEFNDVFNWKIRLPDLDFYKLIFERSGFTERIASFFFDKDYFQDAIEIYLYLLEKNGPQGEFFEKIGYCYQKTEQFEKAVEYYKKAELFDTNRLWLLKKLGWCNLKMKDYHQALSYFKEASNLAPEDITLQNQVAQCYLNLKDYEEALAVYTKLRFFDPNSIKLLRPIAYCQFVLGKLDHADENYNTLLRESSPASAYDLMNAAHVKMCLGERKPALDFYRQSFSSKAPGFEALVNAFKEDVPFLIKNGISPDDIPLIRDFLLYQVEP
ncbi:MAG: tetratricopeptide repeat protein [Bacteroidales bacterium]|jgi:tetratricopeptide (TPR) repeat protein|nr:tetratricopeptide repeat protein [Bacteroidales bacterium]